MIDIAGWSGVAAYVVSYLLLSIDVLKSSQYLFHLLNIVGAVGLIADAAFHRDPPNLAVNVVWLTIGLFAVTKKAVSSRRVQD